MKQSLNQMNGETYAAHIREFRGTVQKQTVKEHCIGVAEIAAQELAKAGLENTAYIGGLLHDMGKYCTAFDDYLYEAVVNESDKRPPIAHSRGGASHLLKLHDSAHGDMEKTLFEYLMLAVLSHHARHDVINTDKEEYYTDTVLPETNTEIESYIKDLKELSKKKIDLAEQEIAAFHDKIRTICRTINNKKIAEEEEKFMYGLLFRLILSGIIKGDHLDTIRFMYRSDPDRDFCRDWNGLAKKMETAFSGNTDTPVNSARSAFSNICGEFGRRHTSGIYTLGLPTGAGKTMSSLRLAAECAAANHKSKVFFIMPMVSILDQNAGSIMKMTNGMVDARAYYSAAEKKDREAGDPAEWFCEDTWGAPIIITSLFQFLQSMFAGSAKDIKRFSSLTDSVIIIDEVQSIPRKELGMFCTAMNFLAYTCGCLVILCSATQPEMMEITHPIVLMEDHEIVKRDEKLLVPFERVRWRFIDGYKAHYGAKALAKLAYTELDDSMLVICNTRNDAMAVYNELSDLCAKTRISLYTVTGLMCHQHQTDILEAAQRDDNRVIVVATRAVEAGVDASFGNVITMAAGADNAVQAAGRCNRNGEYKEKRLVTVIDMEISDKKHVPPEIVNAAAKFRSCVLGRENKDGWFMSDDMLSLYFRKRDGAANAGQETDYPVNNGKGTMYDLLAANKTTLKAVHRDNPHIKENAEWKSRFLMKQSFKTAWETFRVYGQDDVIPVIVPYKEGRNIIQELLSEAAEDPVYRRSLLRRAEPYTVNLYGKNLEALIQAGAVTAVKKSAHFILSDAFYGDEGIPVTSL